MGVAQHLAVWWQLVRNIDPHTEGVKYAAEEEDVDNPAGIAQRTRVATNESQALLTYLYCFWGNRIKYPVHLCVDKGKKQIPNSSLI